MDIDHLLGLGQGLEFAPGPNANRPHTDLQGQAPIAKRQGFWVGPAVSTGKPSVRDCPGGSRPPWLWTSRLRPLNERLMGMVWVLRLTQNLRSRACVDQ